MLFTVYDLSKILEVTDETVRRWIRSGWLETMALTSKKDGYYISYEQLSDFLNKSKHRKYKRRFWKYLKKEKARLNYHL